MPRYLITGGAGFIGSHLVDALESHGAVRVLDDLSSGSAANLKSSQAELIRGSILDRDLLRHAFADVDYVFHLAAFISVPESVEKPHECTSLNVTGLLNVLEAASAAKVRKLCFVSSAAIYGDSPVIPKTETMIPEPGSPYAITKLSGEYFCSEYSQLKNLPTVSVRLFNVFGPRQNPASAYAAVVPAFVSRSLQGEDITIYGDGLQTRDLVYVKDVAGAMVHLTLKGNYTGSYNVGTGRSFSVLDLAKSVRALTQAEGELRFSAPRPGDVRDSIASIDKLRATGFQPQYTLEEGLAETVAAFKGSST